MLALVALAALLSLPAAAIAAKPPAVHAPEAKSPPAKPAPVKSQLSKPGSLTQLSKRRGCIVAASAPSPGCAKGRALKGPGPFMGSRAIAISPDDRYVYVASSRSNAIAIFRRLPGSGALRQARGAAGCIAGKGADGCAPAIGLNGVNSVAISPDGRNLYATARGSDAVTAFRRNPGTGALRQLPGPAGCWSGLPLPGCGQGRGIVGPDVVVASGDGKSVYVGSFFGNAVAAFAREAPLGGLSQLAGEGGCVATAIPGCATALGLGAPEGMAISSNGGSLYVANALANTLLTFNRDRSSGVLSQAPAGCIVSGSLAGCREGVQLSGANAIAIAPGGRSVYVTSLLSDSVASFARVTSTGGLLQLRHTAACLVYLRSAGCSFGRALNAPEGIATSSDGANVYVASFASGAIDVLDRSRKTGAVAQRPGAEGCLAALPGCTPARALKGVSSLAVSRDGRNLYATSFGSNAVNVFRRNR